MEENNFKQKAYEFGKFAEDKAFEYYASKGYAILERNLHIGVKIEIDLIAQKDNIVAFVEVKARNGKFTDAVSSVTLDKMRRISRGAHSYLRKLKGEYEYRFDIFALTGNKDDYTVEVIEDAYLSPLS